MSLHYQDQGGLVMDDLSGWSVRQLIEMLGIPSEEVIAVIINGYPGKQRDIVKDGDVVALIKIMGRSRPAPL